MKAITREEKIISGENLTPITRKEMFLAKASGQNIQIPTPITREEIFLSKITGGGSAKVEGTAIPVGVQVDKIYFNTNLTKEETNAYLSQLTYVQTDLHQYPIYPIYGRTVDGVTGVFIIAVKISEEFYNLTVIYNITNAVYEDIYNPSVNGTVNNGWKNYTYSYTWDVNNYLGVGNVEFTYNTDGIVLTDFNGLPIGAENEKIKNVLSITPFTASTSSGENTSGIIGKSWQSLVDEGYISIESGIMRTLYDANDERNLSEFAIAGELVIPDDVNANSIDVYGFQYIQTLTKITIPDCITLVDDFAFGYCSALVSVKLPNAVGYLGEYAFTGCANLKDINMPNFIDAIQRRTFYSCSSLTNVTIPDSVTSIGSEAFCFCDGLTSVTLSGSLQWVGERAFQWCTSLTEIKFNGTKEQWNDIAFGELWNEGVPATYVQCTDGTVEL